jgi:hypothetical protein
VCCFFLDIRAAFDTVCREFVARFRQHGPEAAAQSVGLSDVEGGVLMRRILAEGTALEQAGASDHLNALVADTLERTWFSTVGVEQDIVGTTCGTIPGDPLGDILFAFLGARVKRTLRLELLAADLKIYVNVKLVRTSQGWFPISPPTRLRTPLTSTTMPSSSSPAKLSFSLLGQRRRLPSSRKSTGHTSLT